MNIILSISLLVMITGTRRALCDAPFYVDIMDAPHGEYALGPSFLDDHVYRPHSIGLSHMMLTAATVVRDHAASFADCHYRAAAKGAHFFEMAGEDTCHLGTLYHPVCRGRKGDFPIHIHASMLSGGHHSDEAYPDPGRVNALLNSSSTSAFRIMSPTILQLKKYFTHLYDSLHTIDHAGDNYLLITDAGSMVAVDNHIVADTTCHTTNPCGVPFLSTMAAASIPPSYILHEMCGRKLKIRKDEEVNLLSHEGIGCEFFPKKYPTSPCVVNFKGSNELQINATLVNFRDGRCEGHVLRVVTFARDWSKKKINLCDEEAPTLLTASGGKATVEFYGTRKTLRKKYGFIINVSTDSSATASG